MPAEVASEEDPEVFSVVDARVTERIWDEINWFVWSLIENNMKNKSKFQPQPGCKQVSSDINMI